MDSFEEHPTPNEEALQRDVSLANRLKTRIAMFCVMSIASFSALGIQIHDSDWEFDANHLTLSQEVEIALGSMGIGGVIGARGTYGEVSERIRYRQRMVERSKNSD